MLEKFKDNIVIDFDSTFVKLEGLEVLAEICLSNDPEKDLKVKQIADITEKGMQGEIGFTESLSKRLQIFSPSQEDVRQLIGKLQENIAERFLESKQYIQKNSDRIYIISGGFKDFILPITRIFDIPDDHVFANEFVWDDNQVIGFESSNPLSQSGGKVETLRELDLNPKTVIAIGDGYTDYEMKERGLVDKFYYFGDNVKRDKVMNLADGVI
jgi:D-3-phosphoglycerate dehydrogenase